MIDPSFSIDKRSPMVTKLKTSLKMTLYVLWNFGPITNSLTRCQLCRRPLQELTFSKIYPSSKRERGREIRRLLLTLFTFSIKRKIRQFHVVIFTAKKCTKINVMHVRSRSRCCRRLVVSSTHSLMLFHRSYLRSWSSDLETWFNQLPSALI